MNVVQIAGRQSVGFGKGAGPISKSATIAALDIGSTKISCVIAEIQPPKFRGSVDPRQRLRVLGVGQTAARGIRAGSVVDVNAAECAIRIAVDSAERMGQTSISEVMVAISGGRPMSSSYAGRVRTQGGAVSPYDLEYAVANALEQVAVGKRTILHLHPVNHVLDGVGEIANPIGLHGDDLQVDIGVTTVEPAYLRNLSQAIEQAHLTPIGFVLSSYAAAKAALATDESALGTIVIDMGGAVTSLALLRNEKLVAAETLNLGGIHLTNDVAQGLSTSVAHAERMKTLWGTVLQGGHGEREMLAVPLLGERGTDAVHKVPKVMLINILRARVEEIFEVVASRLAQGPFASAPAAKVVLTGGASQLPGLRDLASAILQRPVRQGQAAALNGLPEHLRGASFAVSTGALIQAANPDRHYAVPEQAQAQLERARMGYARRMTRWLADAL